MTQEELLKHYLLALEFRCDRAASGVDDDFAAFNAGEGVRTPVELLHHISSLMQLTRDLISGEKTARPAIGEWEEERSRFAEELRMVDGMLHRLGPDDTEKTERIVQGPLADAMTHVGQLIMLRRLYGQPVEAISYVAADVKNRR